MRPPLSSIHTYYRTITSPTRARGQLVPSSSNSIQVSLHQFIPHNAKVPIVGTDLLSIQLLVRWPRGPVGVLAQLVDAQEALLDVIVFGVLLVAPVAGERQPVDGVPSVVFPTLTMQIDGFVCKRVLGGGVVCQLTRSCRLRKIACLCCMSSSMRKEWDPSVGLSRCDLR